MEVKSCKVKLHESDKFQLESSLTLNSMPPHPVSNDKKKVKKLFISQNNIPNIINFILELLHFYDCYLLKIILSIKYYIDVVTTSRLFFHSFPFRGFTNFSFTNFDGKK